ncbi:MAG: M1 family peptidase, partial [Bacteroidia bacterium]
MNKYFILLIAFLMAFRATAQDNTNTNKFKQLGTDLPTPNVYRTATGAPGHQYWQQQADYDMDITLDDENQTVTGSETITYTNNSPDVLKYLWLQLDQNVRAQNSMRDKVSQNKISPKMNSYEFNRLHNDFDGGFKLLSITDANGNKIDFTVVETMLRVDMPKPLRSGGSYTFNIKWWYNINDRMKVGGRSGYEYFKDEDNYLYTIAQFYPRMCVYIDNEGWQNKQFLGNGEFALTFGDYEVDITVPSDHVVAATGMIQNEDEVLSKKQQERW